jgi:membrane protein YdbS with pleckstrin-like domain
MIGALVSWTQMEALEAPASRAASHERAASVLQGNEIIELSIKPSMWFIVIKSARIVTAMVAFSLGIAILAHGHWPPSAVTAVSLTLCIAVLRVGLATLQWASRLYVLTNRRVIVFRGVFSVEADDLLLERIGQLTLDVAPYQRVLGIGSIIMRSADDDPAARRIWKHVANPGEIHRKLCRASEEAQGRSGG